MVEITLIKIIHHLISEPLNFKKVNLSIKGRWQALKLLPEVSMITAH